MGKARQAWVLALGVLILGMGITAVIARAQFDNSILQSRQAALVNTASQELHHTIQSEIQHAVHLVQATGWLFDASQSVSRTEFTEFAIHAIHHSDLLKELQWRPRVSATEAELFVKNARQDGLAGFRLLELEQGNGRFVPAAPRTEYFPIFYSEMARDQIANPALLGVDTLVGMPDFALLQQGIAGGHDVVVSMVSERQILVQVPVFQAGQRDIEHLVGYVSARLLMQPLLHRIEEKAEKLDLDVILLDQQNMPVPILQVVGQQKLGQKQAYQGDSPLDIRLPFSVGDFFGTLLVAPRSSVNGVHTHAVWVVVVAGLLVSLLLAWLLYRMLGEQRAGKLSREQLNGLTDNLPEGVFQMHAGNGVTTHFTFVNASACQLLNVQEERIMEDWQNAFLHLLEEDRHALMTALRHAKDQKQLWEGEFRLRIGNGIRWIRARAVPSYTMLGELVYNGFIEDVTERKRMEQEVSSQSMFLQRLIDTIPSPLFFKAADSRFLGCNQAYEHAFGVSREEIIGKYVLEMEYLPYEERLLYQEEDEHVILTGATIHKEFPLRFADGKWHQVLYWVSGFKLPDGSPGGLVGSIVDITAQREAQHALSLAIDQQKALFDSAPLGILELKNRHVVCCNRKFEQMLGYEASELLGHSTRAWFSSGDDYEMVGHGYAILCRGETYTGEHQFTRKDGSTFWCRIFGHAIDVNSPESHSVWQFEDITERRQIEEQLRMARDAAEEATLAKSMFLANMSHEIRTPMNAVIGLAHLALNTELNPRQHDYVAKIHSAGISLLAVINDILDFSKIESGHMELERTEFSLDHMLDSVASTVAHSASEAELELLFDVADDVPRNLVGDPLRLGQVLLNLVSNAIKFTSEGEVVIRCHLLDSNERKIKLQFSVIDSGIGMDEETCQRLFQPFMQADGSTTRKYGGTGLGLMICKRLVEMMYGDIHVSSISGHGSTFTFTAWFDNGQPAKPYTLSNRLNELHVLIVDDNAAARTIMASQLGFLPCRISHASSGMEAVSTVRDMQDALPVDLVLMDWKMPDMSGMDAARLIKHDVSLSTMPAIVMVTAYGREEIRRECEELKLEGFLVKPVSQSTLVDTLVGIYATKDVENQEEVQPPRSYDLSGMQLLLVEDNEINQQIARELLQAVGASVDIAPHGQAALEKLHNSAVDYDAVLMDLQMPVMDGYEATRQIREDRRYDGLPILAMTAHATLRERERCEELGMVAHITKPINPELFYQTLACIYTQHAQAPSVFNASGSSAADLEIEGFNVADAMRRVAGNQVLYRRLLKQFVRSQQSAVDEIRNALQMQQESYAIRLAHTLKGVAGNLGAQALFDSADKLEQVLREKADYALALEQVVTDLSHAITAINQAFSILVFQPVITHVDVSLGEGMAVLQKLQHYLASHDASVQDFLEDEAHNLHALLKDQQLYDRLEALISAYQFDEALQVLKPWLAKYSQ